MPVFKPFEYSTDLVDVLASKIAADLQRAIDARGRASLVVSGGSTPLPLFRRLSNIGIEWAQVFITLADERWLPADDPESNERLVRQHLLQGKAASAHFSGLVSSDSTPEAGIALVAEKLSHFPKPFDVIVLGMGNDGHTASLFPCSEQLTLAMATEQLLVAVHPTTAPHARLSLSLSALLNARQIYLHIAGESKQQVLEQALVHTDTTQMPIRAVLNQHKTPVDVYWSQK
ncbi:6-phosphogluconolactonase [Ferrimonas lipolytica]|uniref:6-phosphogluconolactonase n=1 Tax=Ferrimonas lipolytica TaxID=2724191 RepID=A0A6H1UJN6_9GAMM|nr:6-phosphogluconolactonase [Ferrimonas lipolytica]QIZ78839.1 6-phosphogluconolactonase [Ferrimonas lipolytica]